MKIKKKTTITKKKKHKKKKKKEDEFKHKQIPVGNIKYYNRGDKNKKGTSFA